MFKAKLILAVVLIFGALGAAGLKNMLTIPPSVGSPMGQSFRAGNDVVTLIRTLEPYIPTLHRNPEKNRYRIALFVSPVEDPARGRMIPIAKGFRFNDLKLARVIGFDGINVWCNVDQIKGVNLKTGAVVGDAELKKANPSLDEEWDDMRRFSCGTRLRVATPDRKQFFEVDPVTLKAAPVLVKNDVVAPLFGVPLESFLSAGVRPSPTKWLALLSPKHAASHYKTKSWLGPINRAENVKELRRFHRGALGPELEKGNREILSMTALSKNEYLNAAFLRTGLDAEPIRLSSPDSFLMIYTGSPAMGATLIVVRVTTEGELVWKADTGLERFSLKQILPHERFPAFVGTKPPVPGKVSEPLLVVISVESGEVSPRSLWK